MDLSEHSVDRLMEAALEQAELAASRGEVPVGAVIAIDDKIIARAHNLVEKNKAISNHAEVLALEQAAKNRNNWRLSDATLCVTIEPCTMCVGALKLSRVKNLIIGAMDPSMGACGSIYDLTQDKRAGHIPRVLYGVREQECASLMKRFFADKRK